MATSDLKPLPYCDISEKTVVSGLITGSEDEIHDIFLRSKAEFFNNRSYRIIFQGFLDLNQKEKPCDMVSVIDHLKLIGRLDEIGGMNTIHSLAAIHHPNFTVLKAIDILKEKFRLRNLIEICEEIKEESYRGTDSLDLIKSMEDKAFEVGMNLDTASENRLISASDALQRMIDARRNKDDCKGLMSGIRSFDEIYNGFQEGQYYILGGRPSAGKTAFADQVAMNMVLKGVPFLYICLEAGDSRVLAKMVCKHAGVSYTKFTKGFCNPVELDSVERSGKVFKGSQMILKRPFSIKGSDIRSIIKRDFRRHGIKLVILDYLQKIDLGRDDERIAIAKASKAIQDTCVETGVPALVLAQLNRDAEMTKRPTMAELKGSGQIEQDADSIAFLWPEEDPFEVPMDQMLPVNLSIEKNKDGARGIDQKIYFDRPLMTFKERTRI